MSDRRMITAANFAPAEGACSCGCGLLPADSIVLAVQALALALAREYSARIRVLITGGVRCQATHERIYRKLNAERARRGLPPRSPPPDSRHLPPHLDALDVRMEVQMDGGRWVRVPVDVIAMWARRVGLFGGIGIDEYRRDGRDIVHLDTRPGRPVMW